MWVCGVLVVMHGTLTTTMAFLTRVLVRTSSLLLALYTTSRIRALRVHTASFSRKCKRNKAATKGGGEASFDNDHTEWQGTESRTQIQQCAKLRVACEGGLLLGLPVHRYVA